MAQELKLSKSTISLALQDSAKLKVSTKQRVKAYAMTVGYRKDPVMAQLMARMRMRSKPAYQGTLALVSFDPRLEAWSQYGCVRSWVTGARSHAHNLGYSTECFNAHAYSPSSLARILRNRNIQGYVIPVANGREIRKEFDFLLREFAVACIGVKMRRPPLHHSYHDVFFSLELACEQMKRRGCQRIAMVVNTWLDNLMSGLYSSGYLKACEHLLLPVLPIFDSMSADLGAFKNWVSNNSPDGILTLWAGTKDWIERLGYRIPIDIAMAHLDASENPGWAGIDQHHGIVGAAAVDLVIGQILRQERGIPRHPKTVLIAGTWLSGPTLRHRKLSQKSLVSPH